MRQVEDELREAKDKLLVVLDELRDSPSWSSLSSVTQATILRHVAKVRVRKRKRTRKRRSASAKAADGWLASLTGLGPYSAFVHDILLFF